MTATTPMRLFPDLSDALERELMGAVSASNDGYPDDLDNLLAWHECITDAHVESAMAVLLAACPIE